MELLGLPSAGSLLRENIPTELRFPHRFCAALLQFFQLQQPSWRRAFGSHCGQDFWNSTRCLTVVNRFPNTRLLRGSLCFQRSTYRLLILRVLQGFVDAAHIFVSSDSTQVVTDEPLSSRRVKSLSTDSVGEKLAAALAIAAGIAWITDAVSWSRNPELKGGAIGSIRSSSNSRATS